MEPMEPSLDPPLDDCTDRPWRVLVIVLVNHTSGSINVKLNIHFTSKFRKTLVEILVLKLLQAQQYNPSL